MKHTELETRIHSTVVVTQLNDSAVTGSTEKITTIKLTVCLVAGRKKQLKVTGRLTLSHGLFSSRT